MTTAPEDAPAVVSSTDVLIAVYRVVCAACCSLHVLWLANRHPSIMTDIVALTLVCPSPSTWGFTNGPHHCMTVYDFLCTQLFADFIMQLMVRLNCFLGGGTHPPPHAPCWLHICFAVAYRRILVFLLIFLALSNGCKGFPSVLHPLTDQFINILKSI